LSSVLTIRGIYATALTRFFLDRGFKVALPSEPITDRFTASPAFDVFEGPDARILNLESKQGILVLGEEEVLEELLAQVREGFIDAVTRMRAKDVLEIEFPLLSKSRLDEIRGTVLPTLPLHHRLKIIASDQVDSVERKTLAQHPELRESLGRNMERELIWNGYETGRQIAIEHVKPEGRVLYLSEGEVVQADFMLKKLVLKRSGFKGRDKYDGLGIPKHGGDYAVSELREGDWHYRHTYFRAQGEIIGSYYNINTPVEFYPDRIRYLDLEIDVVQFPNRRVEILDETELRRRFEQGYISGALREKAIGEASRLCARLQL